MRGDDVNGNVRSGARGTRFRIRERGRRGRQIDYVRPVGERAAAAAATETRNSLAVVDERTAAAERRC